MTALSRRALMLRYRIRNAVRMVHATTEDGARAHGIVLGPITLAWFPTKPPAPKPLPTWHKASFYEDRP